MSSTKQLKQGSLFSFFTKKPKVTATKPIKPVSSGSSDSKTNKTTSTATSLAIGTQVEVYWQDDDTYYGAKVAKRRSDTSTYFLEYDDQTTEWIDLSKEDYRIVTNNSNSNKNNNNSALDKRKKEQQQPQKQTNQDIKRRKIQESDQEDEFQFDDDMDDNDDDDGSAYAPVNKEQDEQDHLVDNDWMVTDDEDDLQPNKKQSNNEKNKNNTYKVTPHAMTTPQKKDLPVASAESYKTPSSSSSPSLGQYANTVSPSSAPAAPATVVTPAVRRQIGTSFDNTPKIPTTASTAAAAAKKKITKPVGKITMYQKGIVNPKGSHVHNHLKFLQNPKDSAGRSVQDPGYDPRTLKIVSRDMEAHGVKLTAAVQQWWNLKAQYFDTVLLFKTGKFYEMFHMDADVGVDICGFLYMKGHIAHAGFPEISYGTIANKLVQAGYKVARVEQTETPDMLKHRKAKTGKGQKKPQVVNREVCSILTMGTRTFCYLEDRSGLADLDGSNGGGGGPLLAIREILKEPAVPTSSSSDDDDDAVRPVCEYGVTLIDAVRAEVTLGQFADDVLRSRMHTLLTTFTPSEILIQGNADGDGASPTLHSVLKAHQNSSPHPCRVETIHTKESFPKSTALDPAIRRQLERGSETNGGVSSIHPWEIQETIKELHRRGYYPRASRHKTNASPSISRWPAVLKAAIEGNAELCMSSFGAALFYLQRNLIDAEILSMGLIKAYIPPAVVSDRSNPNNTMAESNTSNESTPGGVRPSQQSQIPLEMLMSQQTREEAGDESNTNQAEAMQLSPSTPLTGMPQISSNPEDQINNMSLDGTTLHNLEILTNAVDHKVQGSLWSKINFTKSPHGARLLRAWLLRPLFRKADIDRRADAVEELRSGAASVAVQEAQQQVLSRMGDLERLLSRVHSMGGSHGDSKADSIVGDVPIHPGERAILYEGDQYTKRKVGDFSKLLNGLRVACRIPEIFADVDLQSGLLKKIVKSKAAGGCYPDMTEELDWFFENFDCDKAAKGTFEPTRGMDDEYDAACDEVQRIRTELADYKEEMCNTVLRPRQTARGAWKYINIKPESKDKYLIELPASIEVPDDFVVKGKRGSGTKQVNKYRSGFIAEILPDFEAALDIQKKHKAKGMQLLFAKFDSLRSKWAAAAQATALLDALGSLAKVAARPGFCRATIVECPAGTDPTLKVVQGRHPCVVNTISASEFIPNDLTLGSAGESDKSRVLLLSGPNMGGKSTLLRQTCLIAILAQIGSFVPAESCELTPVDCIYTRLGASDRILLGQSTFFVELAETAVALRGATRRSLVIMDELGRGTSTFDGTAIAGATVKHLVERSRCLSLFATHYHSLLDEWRTEPEVRLGHMECLVEDENDGDGNDQSQGAMSDKAITFLYTLGEGTCPKSFGINVARLASLPNEVLVSAKRASEEFEAEVGASAKRQRLLNDPVAASQHKSLILDAIRDGRLEELQSLWEEMNG